MEKLISMTNFVLNGQQTADYIKLYDGCFKYANFLKQELNLGMFVPAKLVNGVWVVLEEPIDHGYLGSQMIAMQAYLDRKKEYQEVKDRVLFEGFYVENGIVFTPEKQVLIQKSMLDKMNIEHLVGLNYSLTPTANKLIGL